MFFNAIDICLWLVGKCRLWVRMQQIYNKNRGAAMKDKTATTIMTIIGAFVFFWALTFARVPYECKPITPPEQCETGAYEIWFFEHENARRPHGVVDAHCVYKSDGRLVAETLRLTSYDQTGKIRDVEWFERQEFPDSHAEVCQVK